MIKDWHYKILDEFQENLKKDKKLAYNPESYLKYSEDGIDVVYVLTKLSLKHESDIVTTIPDIRLKLDVL